MGFEPFGKFKINPSENYAKYFPNHLILPVNNKIESIVDNLNIDKYKVIFMIGLSSEIKVFHLELVAKNKKADRKVDENEKIDKDRCDMMLTTTIDIGSFRILPKDVVWSVDAGNYYCNELYYRMLLKCQFTDHRIIFCHVPQFKSIPFERGIKIITEIIEKINY